MKTKLFESLLILFLTYTYCENNVYNSPFFLEASYGNNSNLGMFDKMTTASLKSETNRQYKPNFIKNSALESEINQSPVIDQTTDKTFKVQVLQMYPLEENIADEVPSSGRTLYQYFATTIKTKQIKNNVSSGFDNEYEENQQETDEVNGLNAAKIGLLSNQNNSLSLGVHRRKESEQVKQAYQNNMVEHETTHALQLTSAKDKTGFIFDTISSGNSSTLFYSSTQSYTAHTDMDDLIYATKEKTTESIAPYQLSDPNLTVLTTPLTTNNRITSSQTSTVAIQEDLKTTYTSNLPIYSQTFMPVLFRPALKNMDFTTKMYLMNSTKSSRNSSESLEKEPPQGDSFNSIVVIVVIIGVMALTLVMTLMYVIRKRQKQTNAGRCRPVSLNAYSLDSLSVFNSVRRRAKNLRTTKRPYTNTLFEDNACPSNPLNIIELQAFLQNKYAIYEEFKNLPVISSRIDELPQGCEDKNRYANVVPLPETRVFLSRIGYDETTEYINANYVKGPTDKCNMYIASQAPMKNTLFDFWRMIWEQNCRIIIQLTDLNESGVEKCAEYIPQSVVLENVCKFDSFMVTLKCREVKGKYAVSTIHLKNNESKSWREVVHFWYTWPEAGVPFDETSVITMLLEAQSILQSPLADTSECKSKKEVINIDMKRLDTSGSNNSENTSSFSSCQGPMVVHCSPGTSRTGTIICCDIIIRELQPFPTKKVDIPKVVFTTRRCRASSVQTKQQYEFIYKVAAAYSKRFITTKNS